MTSIAYVNRKTEQKEAITDLLSSEAKILLYQCNSGYGITAFFERLQYVLQSTDGIVIFNTELSDDKRDPIHQIVKNLTASDSNWTQTMQSLADDVYGEHEDSMLKGALKGLPYVGEFFAALADTQKALPIYTGFYADRLKELFFNLIRDELHDKSIYIFIDNIQFIGTSSICEIISLLQMQNIKLVLSYTGIADAADKLLLEIECSFYRLCRKLFGMPDESHIIELGEVLHSVVTPQKAKDILFHSNGNIRKIIYEIKKGSAFENANQSVMKVMLSILWVCKTPLYADELFSMVSISHVGILTTDNACVDALRCLEARGFLYTALTLDRKKQVFPLFDATTNTIWDNLRSDLADMLVSKSLVLRYLLNARENLPFDRKRLGFSLARELREPLAFWCRQLVVEALQIGCPIESEWLEGYAPEGTADQFIYAIALYKNFMYTKAKEILESLCRQSFKDRNVKLLYAYKYLQLSLSITRSIMPKAYATINLCGYHLARKEYDIARNLLLHLRDKVMATNLHRLKARFSLAYAAVNYICDNAAEAKEYLSEHLKNSEHTIRGTVNVVYQTISQKLEDEIVYQDSEDWRQYFFPCFLEYWISNPLCVISDDALSLKAIS